MVNMPKTMRVISAPLAGLYCALIRQPIRDVPDIGQRNLPSQRSILNYSAWLWLAGSALLACHGGTARAAEPASQDWTVETGTASFYGRAHQGRRTASGELFDQQALTAAHPWLPFGTRVRVTLLGTTRSVVVVVTDRIYSNRRIMDLSLAAARTLGMVRQGIAAVSLTPG